MSDNGDRSDKYGAYEAGEPSDEFTDKVPVEEPQSRPSSRSVPAECYCGGLFYCSGFWKKIERN